VRKAEEDAAKERAEQKAARSYDALFDAEKMRSNKDDGNDSDEFM